MQALTEVFEIVILPCTYFRKYIFHITLFILSVASLESFSLTLFSFQGADLSFFKSSLRASDISETCSRPLIKGKLGGPKWTRTTDLTIISRAL